jgi:hypothetical protein
MNTRPLALRHVLAAARACYGGVLLLAPGPAIRVCTRRPASSRARHVTRVLGARHLVQAALTAAAPPGAAGPGIGAAVDLAHATSMVALALADHADRRATLADAAIATVFAGGGLVADGGAAGPQLRAGVAH